jgi:effector-binding domain-containing protein
MRPLEPPQEIKDMAQSGEIRVKTTEPCEVIFLVLKGSHAGVQDGFLKLMRWASENGYELMGPGMAVFHNDLIIVGKEEDLITELRFPVRKK